MNAEFKPPVEKLAFRIADATEKDFPWILAAPLPVVINALTQNTSVEQVFKHLPDIVETDTQVAGTWRIKLRD